MATAKLIGEGLSQFCPITNHYECDDGKYLLVTIPSLDVAGTIESKTGIKIPVSASHLPARAEVFLANHDARVLDADGDLSNGMTTLAVFDGITDHAEALAELGYTVT